MFGTIITTIIIVTILACATLWAAQLVVSCTTDCTPTTRDVIIAAANGVRWIVTKTKEVVTMFTISSVLFVLAIRSHIRDFAETTTDNLIGLAKFIAIFVKMTYGNVRDCLVAAYIRVMSFVDITKEVAIKVATAIVRAVHKTVEIAKAMRWAICTIAKLAVWVFGGMNSQMERDIDALWNAIDAAKAIGHKAMRVTTDIANTVRWATHVIAKIAVLVFDGMTAEAGKVIDTAYVNTAAVYAAVVSTVSSFIREMRHTMLMIKAIIKLTAWIIGGIEAELDRAINTPVHNPVIDIRRGTVCYLRKWRLATRF